MKRTGRPRLDDDDETVQICVKIPSRQYDALYQQARADRVSIPERIRRELQVRSPEKRYPK